MSEPRIKKRIFTTTRNKPSAWARLMSLITASGIVAIATIVALLIAQHFESGSSVSHEMAGWFNWIGQLAGAEPFVTVAVIAVLGLIGLAFYARDH